MKRFNFSSDVTDALIASSGDKRWTRDIPMGAQSKELNARSINNELMVVPAKESNGGRGAPLFDLYHPVLSADGMKLTESDYLISLKVSEEARLPRSVVLSTGTERHILGILQSVRQGARIPVLVFNRIGDRWFRLFFSADQVLRANTPREADGTRGHIVTLSKTVRPSGHNPGCSCPPGEVCGRITYTGLRINLAPMIAAGYGDWSEVIRPELPRVAIGYEFAQAAK